MSMSAASFYFHGFRSRRLANGQFGYIGALLTLLEMVDGQVQKPHGKVRWACNFFEHLSDGHAMRARRPLSPSNSGRLIPGITSAAGNISYIPPGQLAGLPPAGQKGVIPVGGTRCCRPGANICPCAGPAGRGAVDPDGLQLSPDQHVLAWWQGAAHHQRRPHGRPSNGIGTDAEPAPPVSFRRSPAANWSRPPRALRHHRRLACRRCPIAQGRLPASLVPPLILIDQPPTWRHFQATAVATITLAAGAFWLRSTLVKPRPLATRCLPNVLCHPRSSSIIRAKLGAWP